MDFEFDANYPDYESLILDRQEREEIWEDEPDSPYLQIRGEVSGT